MATVDLRLPKPYPLQAEILRSTAKRKIVCTGRRVGKTTTGALAACETGLAGKKCLIVSTSQDQADIFWNLLTAWLDPLFRAKLARKNENKRTIQFWNGGAIKVKTGKDANALRGFDADLLIVDEAAFLDPTAYYEAGAPMLADRDGTAMLFSTPFRKNWFHVEYTKAVNDMSGRMAAWHATSYDNPFLKPEVLDALKADMSEDSFKQEIMAEFLEGAGQVFRNIDNVCNLDPEWVSGLQPDTLYYMGVDTAQKRDYTVAVVLDDSGRQVDMLRFNRVGWETYRQRIITLAKRWNVANIVFEINSAGGPNYEALEAEGLPMEAFTTGATTKPPLIESLVLAFERNEIRLWDDPIVKGELGTYEKEVNPGNNRVTYSAPEGMNDDIVIATALAWHGLKGRMRLRARPNPIFGGGIVGNYEADYGNPLF